MPTHPELDDRSLHLGKQPDAECNLRRPDITPLVVWQPGDEWDLGSRDAFDPQFEGNVTASVVAASVGSEGVLR